MKELTFTEVIANIKEDEVWESDYVAIYKKNGGISISFKKGKVCSMHTFSCSTKYKLHRKEYTFQEAFKAYEEGKEIESCIEGHRYKKEGGEDYYFDYGKNKYMLLEWDRDGFTITSIRNKWYIND